MERSVRQSPIGQLMEIIERDERNSSDEEIMETDNEMYWNIPNNARNSLNVQNNLNAQNRHYYAQNRHYYAQSSHCIAQKSPETGELESNTSTSFKRRTTAINRPLMKIKMSEEHKSEDDVFPIKMFRRDNHLVVGHVRECIKRMDVCYICGGKGHTSYRCHNRFCFKCESRGHVAQDCLNHKCPANKFCFRCYLGGNLQETKPGAAGTCPLRQTSTVYCYNCGSSDHLAYRCEKKPETAGGQPTYPFIVGYNTFVELRENRKRFGKAEFHEKTKRFCFDAETIYEEDEE